MDEQTNQRRPDNYVLFYAHVLFSWIITEGNICARQTLMVRFDFIPEP